MNMIRNTLAAALLAGLTSTAMADSMATDLSEANKEGRVWTSFALNPHLDAFDLGVDVDDDKAILTGTVHTNVEKELATQVALSVSGVKSVDNRIKVDGAYTVAPRGTERTAGQIATDATITATVKNQLLWNSGTDGFDIDVDTTKRTVILSGSVDTEASKALAGRIARNTSGVRTVQNNLKVDANLKRDASTVVEDAWITARVKSSLLYSKYVDGLDIDVDTAEGKVSLKGSVSTAAEKALAIELASNVKGVKRVDASALSTRG